MHFGSFRVVSDIYMESDIGAMQRCLTAVCEVDPMCMTYIDLWFGYLHALCTLNVLYSDAHSLFWFGVNLWFVI